MLCPCDHTCRDRLGRRWRRRWSAGQVAAAPVSSRPDAAAKWLRKAAGCEKSTMWEESDEPARGHRGPQLPKRGDSSSAEYRGRSSLRTHSFMADDNETELNLTPRAARTASSTTEYAASQHLQSPEARGGVDVSGRGAIGEVHRGATCLNAGSPSSEPSCLSHKLSKICREA